MNIVYERCAGLDVHKQSVVACRIVLDKAGQPSQEIRIFGSMTADLLQLSDWLRARQITHVAMESTGVYWKPVYNILEGSFEVLLVNAKHIKFVPGCKTDVKDAQWIAELLQHGLRKASFIPPQAQRDLRELIRYRTHLVDERAREINRVHKVLEDANLKLSAVATDIIGVSARDMLSAIIAGQDDPSVLAQLARRRLRSKIAELEQALTGRMRESHRLLLSLHLEHIDDLNAKLERLEQEIDQALPPCDPDAEDKLARLQTIPGVGRTVAQIILAEVGSDMSRFPNAAHLASWADLPLVKTKVRVAIVRPKPVRPIAMSSLPWWRRLRPSVITASPISRRSLHAWQPVVAKNGQPLPLLIPSWSLLITCFVMARSITT